MLQNDCAVMVVTSKARTNSQEAVFAAFPFNRSKAGCARGSPAMLQLAHDLWVLCGAGRTPRPQSLPFRLAAPVTPTVTIEALGNNYFPFLLTPLQ